MARMMKNSSDVENGVSSTTQTSKISNSNYVRMSGTSPILPGSVRASKKTVDANIFDPPPSILDSTLDLESRDTSPNVQPQNYHQKQVLSDERTQSNDYVIHDEIDEVDFKSAISRARHLAERGPFLLQIATFFGGVGMVVTSAADFELTWKTSDAVDIDYVTITMYTWLFGIFIMGLEGRSVLLDIGALHTAISNYMKIFRFVWGRGLFLMFAGSLQFSLGSSVSTVYGACIMSLGFILFACGMICNAILNARIEAVPRDNETESKFDFFDSDHDGYITSEEFRDFAIYMKIQDFEETEYDVEFLNIDTDNDGLVSYPEVKTWIDAVLYRKDRIMAMFEKASDYIV
jgi:hypothetical protein